MTAAPLLSFEGVACVRSGRLLFRGVDFAVRPSEILVVVGPNGIGKSSLIRLAAGLLQPFAGKVTKAGMTALADEGTALDDRLGLANALRFWSKLDGSTAERAMEAMGLSRLADVPVRILSTGQRKRATLARVIASGAPLWLLDEPANGLDSESAKLLGNAIERHCSAGGAVVAASHVSLNVTGASTLALEEFRP